MDFTCVPSRGWMGRTPYSSAFERGRVVGARRTGLCQELQRCWVFHAQQLPVCIKNGPPPKGHPANWTQLWEALESTWASIPVERFQHLVESMPRLRLFWEQKGRCNLILELCSWCFVHSVGMCVMCLCCGLVQAYSASGSVFSSGTHKSLSPATRRIGESLLGLLLFKLVKKQPC